MKWGVYITYALGHTSLVDIFDSELDAFKCQEEIKQEYWVTKEDKIFYRVVAGD